MRAPVVLRSTRRTSRVALARTPSRSATRNRGAPRCLGYWVMGQPSPRPPRSTGLQVVKLPGFQTEGHSAIQDPPFPGIGKIHNELVGRWSLPGGDLDPIANPLPDEGVRSNPPLQNISPIHIGPGRGEPDGLGPGVQV